MQILSRDTNIPVIISIVKTTNVKFYQEQRKAEIYIPLSIHNIQVSRIPSPMAFIRMVIDALNRERVRFWQKSSHSHRRIPEIELSTCSRAAKLPHEEEEEGGEKVLVDTGTHTRTYRRKWSIVRRKKPRIPSMSHPTLKLSLPSPLFRPFLEAAGGPWTNCKGVNLKVG